jgi:hypothetical protein
VALILGNMTGYSDGRVTCTDQEIVIRHYYPLGPKHIRYTDIRQVKVAPLGVMSRWRIHGSGDLVLYLAGTVRPVITPDDPQAVATELAAHGINVTSGREAGLW